MVGRDVISRSIRSITTGILCAMIVNVPAQAESAATVIWRIADWPPFYEARGARQGQGVCDRMIAIYQAALPQFNHSRAEMTTMRALQQMKNLQEGIAICHVSILRDSLTNFAYASDVAGILPAHVIIARRNVSQDIRRLSERTDGFVSIEKLFLTENLRGAHSSFGTHAALKRFIYEDAPLPNVTITAESYRNLIELFLNGRVDYIIQYPAIFDQLIAAGGQPDDIDIIPIAETSEMPYVKFYVGCSKNAIGHEVINTVNRLLYEKPAALQEARLVGTSDPQRAHLKQLYEAVVPRLNDY